MGEDVHLGTRRRIAAVVEALGDRLKIYSDIIGLGRYFFTETLTHDPDAVKRRLRKAGVPEMLRGLNDVLAVAEPFDTKTLEAAIHAFGESTGIKMGDVVNPLRVATTGQGVGPGLYETPGDLRPRVVPGADRDDLGDARRGPARMSQRLRKRRREEKGGTEADPAKSPRRRRRWRVTLLLAVAGVCMLGASLLGGLQPPMVTLYNQTGGPLTEVRVAFPGGEGPIDADP